MGYVDDLEQALDNLTEDISRRASEADFEQWIARGEDPASFDWMHVNITDIDSDEARAVFALWNAFNTLRALFPLAAPVHLDIPLTNLCVSYGSGEEALASVAARVFPPPTSPSD